MKRQEYFDSKKGEEYTTFYGTKLRIVEYRGNTDVDVLCVGYDYIMNVTYQNLTKMNVRTPFDKGVFGVGYLGVDNIPTRDNEFNTKAYQTWHGMLKRCYSKKTQEKQKNYVGCTVAEEWHDFSVFYKWFCDNYYEVDGERMELDKDILKKGNTIYSKENCIFVPKRINTLMIKSKSKKGKYPMGVTFDKRSRKYCSQCSNGDKRVHLGTYNNEVDAFNAYKEYKEELIKNFANKYKDDIPYKLYTVMMNYNIEITD